MHATKERMDLLETEFVFIYTNIPAVWSIGERFHEQRKYNLSFACLDLLNMYRTVDENSIVDSLN